MFDKIYKIFLKNFKIIYKIKKTFLEKYFK